MDMKWRTFGTVLLAVILLLPCMGGMVFADDAAEAAPPAEVVEEEAAAALDKADATVAVDAADAEGEEAQATDAAATAGQIIRYPGVEIDRAAREVRVEARLSPDLHYEPTLLEFLLIRSIERAYESAFVTDAKPSHIQLGLLLLGLKPGSLPEPEPAGLRSRPLDRPDGEVADAIEQAETGALVDILIRWTEDDGTPKESRIEEFLFSRATGKTPPPTPFAFTGSYFLRGGDGEMQLAADVTDAVVAVLYDPHASVNLPYYEGSPYTEDLDAGFVIQTESVPESFLGEVEIHVIGKKPLPRSDRPVQIVFRPSTVELTIPERFLRAREAAAARAAAAEGGEGESATPEDPEAEEDASESPESE